MPWFVSFDGPIINLKHLPDADSQGQLWGGPVELWRGAPGAQSHPELEHAFLRVQNLALHGDFIRHRWTWEIPDHWQGAPNVGDNLRYMVLAASGGMLNWTLVLRFPPRTPQFVFAAVAAAFNATSKHVAIDPKRLAAKDTLKLRRSRARKRAAMKPTQDMPAKPAKLTKGEVTMTSQTPPAATQAGIKSINKGSE